MTTHKHVAPQSLLLSSPGKVWACQHFTLRIALSQSMFARAVQSHRVCIEELGEILSSPTQILPQVWESIISAASEAGHLTQQARVLP